MFEGTIQDAWADYTSQPTVSFNINAYTGLAAAIAATPPRSYIGTVNVADIAANIAASLKLTFKNNGVTSTITDEYLSGTAWTQLTELAENTGINYDVSNGTLYIWPANGNKATTGTIPLIAPETGLIGYPTYTRAGIALKTLFNPRIEFGALVQVKSSLPQACGKWAIYSLQHDLESETPNGAWFTLIEAADQHFATRTG